MFSEHIVLTLITLCYVLPVCSSDQDSCWQNSRLINTLLCHLYRTPLHQTIQDSWIYVELQISRLIILWRVHSFIRSGLTRVRWEDTGAAAWTSQQVIFLASKFDAQVKYSPQQVFVGLAPFLLDDVVISNEKVIAIQERRRRLHTSSSCSHRWQQTCDQVNAI